MKIMLQAFRILLFTLLFVSTVSWAFATPAIDLTRRPHSIIRDIANALVAQIKEDKARGNINFEEVSRAYDQILMPTVDMAKISRTVMAKYYKDITPENKKKFEEAFRKALIRLYVKALNKYHGQNFRVYSQREEEKRATVKVEIVKEDGTVIPITYALYRNDQGKWLIYNVYFAGINFLLTYRNLFSAAMQKYNGAFDKVLDELALSAPMNTYKEPTKQPTAEQN